MATAFRTVGLSLGYWAKASGAALLLAALQGCVALPMHRPDYVSYGHVRRHDYPGTHEPLRSPSGIFPYGSRVACPQVSIGHGMARCQ